MTGNERNTSQPMTADHWWWRDGWTVGTRLYTWHATFPDDPLLHAHAAAYRELLGGFTQLDLVPDRGLHMTMQGVGFTADLHAEQITALADTARKKLSTLAPIALRFDKPAFTPEAVRWDPVPVEPVSELRHALRSAIGEVFGSVPESADGFVPHVTIAYGNRAAPASAIITAIEECSIPPATVTIEHADLIVLGRDRHEYEWQYAARVPLGG